MHLTKSISCFDTISHLSFWHVGHIHETPAANGRTVFSSDPRVVLWRRASPSEYQPEHQTDASCWQQTNTDVTVAIEKKTDSLAARLNYHHRVVRLNNKKNAYWTRARPDRASSTWYPSSDRCGDCWALSFPLSWSRRTRIVFKPNVDILAQLKQWAPDSAVKTASTTRIFHAGDGSISTARERASGAAAAAARTSCLHPWCSSRISCRGCWGGQTTVPMSDESPGSERCRSSCGRGK